MPAVQGGQPPLLNALFDEGKAHASRKEIGRPRVLQIQHSPKYKMDGNKSAAKRSDTPSFYYNPRSKQTDDLIKEIDKGHLPQPAEGTTRSSFMS